MGTEKGQRLLICANRVLTPAEYSSRNPGTWLSLPNLKILLKLQKELTKNQLMLELLLGMLKRKKRTQLKTKKKVTSQKKVFSLPRNLNLWKRRSQKWRSGGMIN